MTSNKIPLRSMRQYGSQDILVYRLSEFSQQLHNFVRPHREEAALLYHFSQAQGRLFIDQESYPIEGGETLLLRPQQVHFWEGEQVPEGYLLLFDAQRLLDKLVWSFSQLPTGLPLQAEQAPIAELLDLLYQQSSQEDLAPQYLHLLLLHLKQAQPETKTSAAQDYQWEKVETFRQLIEQHFHEKRSPADYAKLLFISSNYLNKLVKQQTGKTAGQLIRERIVLEMKRLLRYTNTSISEIAQELGFDNLPYCTTFFKNHTGHSPSAYRKQSKELE